MLVGLVGRDRLVDEHRAVVRAQSGRGHGLHLLGGDVQNTLDGGQRQLRVAEQHREAAQFVGAPGHRAQPVEPLPLQLRLGALHLLGRRALGGEPRELLVHGRLDGGDLDPAGGLDVQPAQGGRPGQAQHAEAGRDGALVAAYQPVVQQRGLAAAQDGQRHVGGVALAGAVVRQPVGGHQRTRRDLLDDLLTQLLPDDVGQRAVARRLLAVVRGDGAEVLLHPGERLLGIDVPDDGEHRVVGRVVRTEEGARVLQGGGVQVGHGADRGVVVRVALGVGQGGEPLEGRAVGNVVVPLAALVLDDVALVLHGLVVQGGQQGPHPVRLQPERELQLVGRHRLEVVGALEAGGAVEGTAGALDQFEVAVARYARRPLEHQVLEEVSQAGTSLDFVARADVVPEADRGDRGQVVLGEHHAQAVGQPVLGRCQAAGAGLGCGRVTHGHVIPSIAMQRFLIDLPLYASASAAG